MNYMDDEKPVVFIVGDISSQTQSRLHRAFEKVDCTIHHYDVMDSVDGVVIQTLQDKKSFLEKFGVTPEQLSSSLLETTHSDVATINAEKIQRLDNLRKKINKRGKKRKG